MAKNPDSHDDDASDPRGASLRVTKKLRDLMKVAAATRGVPLHQVTAEAIEAYLKNHPFGVKGLAIRGGSTNARTRSSKR